MAITDAPATTVVTASEERSYVDWPAILAGTLIATAISFVLVTFGSAIGLSLTSAYEGSGISLTGFAIAAALWMIWVQVSGFFAGGYATGRLRRRAFDATEHESDIRDGAHGLTVWALGLLLGAFLAFSGLTAAISTAANAVSNAAGGAAAGAAEMAADAVDTNGLTIDRFLRGTAAPANGAPADDGALRDEIGRVLAASVRGEAIDPADRQYLVDALAARGVDPQQAEQRVEQLWTQAQQAEAAARDAADRARRIGVIAAFITAVSTLISAAAAYYGAVLGGNHRDRQVILDGWVRPW